MESAKGALIPTEHMGIRSSTSHQKSPASKKSECGHYFTSAKQPHSPVSTPQIESRGCLGAEDGGEQECSVRGLGPQDSSVLGRAHCRRVLKFFSSNLRARFRSMGFNVFRMEETTLLRQAR